MGWAMLFTLVMCIWGGGYKFLLKTDRNIKGPAMDLFDTGYIWYLFVCCHCRGLQTITDADHQLYMSYGLLDSLWQVFCYYTMGAMSNDPRKLAYYAGFYKSIQAVGATAISKLDAVMITRFALILSWTNSTFTGESVFPYQFWN
jgi:hypothetical protein